jgi:CubicO group peptidase (beta-lactamase class C family)
LSLPTGSFDMSAQIAKRAGLLWLCGLILLLVVSPLKAQSPAPKIANTEPDFSTARKLIRDRMAAESVPSFSVAVAQKGKILWTESFGWSDRENKVPATPHTPYYVASVTKTITATAIMVLHERGQLNIDRPINAYLGRGRLSSPLWNVDEATVRRVATHTAGLTTFVQNRFGAPRSFSFPQDRIIQRYGIVFWPPGDHFDYSNLGFGILGEVVGRVSGRNYGAFLRDEIFRPLEMTDSSLGVPYANEKNAARRYDSKLGLRSGVVSGTPGASTAYCSAEDLLKFGMFHLKSHQPRKKRVLSDKAIDEMLNATVAVGDGGRYGIGWWIKEDLYGYRGALAQGGTNDGSASLQLIPSEGIVVVALANTGTTLPGDFIHEVLSTLLPKYRERRAKDLPRTAQPSPKPTPAMVGNWDGLIRTFSGDVPLSFSISESGEIGARLGNETPTLVSNVSFEKVSLFGRMSGKLPIEQDAGSDPYDLDFELYLRGLALNGSVTTRPHPGAKNFTRLPFWVEFKKMQPSKP